jgi:hypothetical protein
MRIKDVIKTRKNIQLVWGGGKAQLRRERGGEHFASGEFKRNW